jgi:hypothetical protein
VRLITLGAAVACVALVGCAEKTESQRISDAVKAEVAQRGKPTQINCKQSGVPRNDPQISGIWVCAVTLRHAHTRYATCGFWEDTNAPVGECAFFRKRREHPEILVIK